MNFGPVWIVFRANGKAKLMFHSPGLDPVPTYLTGMMGKLDSESSQAAHDFSVFSILVNDDSTKFQMMQ